MVLHLGIALFTPPVGAVLFVCCSIAQINMREMIRAFMPFFLGVPAVLMVVTSVPSLSLWLPRALKRRRPLREE